MSIEKIDIEKVKGYISEMYSKKPLYSNYFNQMLSPDDYYSKTTHTLLISKAFTGFNRIYLLSDNIDDATKVLKTLKGINVLNIPSKGDISHWEKLMHQSDFELISIYERFYNTNIRKRDEKEAIIYAIPGQEKEIYNLFHESGFFSIYTDFLPSYEEIKKMIEQKNVIVNVVDKQIQGAFVFLIEGLKCNFQAWIDMSNNRLKLLFDAYNIVVEKNLAYVYLWVNSENKKVKSIHRMMGAKPDGLKDYTFIKNK